VIELEARFLLQATNARAIW